MRRWFAGRTGGRMRRRLCRWMRCRRRGRALRFRRIDRSSRRSVRRWQSRVGRTRRWGWLRRIGGCNSRRLCGRIRRAWIDGLFRDGRFGRKRSRRHGWRFCGCIGRTRVCRRHRHCGLGRFYRRRLGGRLGRRTRVGRRRIGGRGHRSIGRTVDLLVEPVVVVGKPNTVVHSGRFTFTSFTTRNSLVGSTLEANMSQLTVLVGVTVSLATAKRGNKDSRSTDCFHLGSVRGSTCNTLTIAVAASRDRWEDSCQKQRRDRLNLHLVAVASVGSFERVPRRYVRLTNLIGKQQRYVASTTMILLSNQDQIGG